MHHFALKNTTVKKDEKDGLSKNKKLQQKCNCQKITIEYPEHM